ncbi:hypothetical protein FCS21_16205, partial [Colwellia ponticola]
MSINIKTIQKLIARSIFSSGMKRNFYRDQFLTFAKFILLRLVSREKRIISSLTLFYRDFLYFLVSGLLRKWKRAEMLR